MRLPDINAKPMIGWKYDLETQDGSIIVTEGRPVTIVGRTWVDLLLKIDNALRSLKIDYDRRLLPRAVQNQICKRQVSKGGNCIQDDGEMVRVMGGRHLTFNDYIAGTAKQVSKIFEVGKKFVDHALAVERAKTCAECPLNVKTPVCVGCDVAKWFSSILAKTLNRTTETPYDAKLQSCAACMCFCKVIIHWPLKDLDISSDERKLLPPKCWKLKKL